MTEIEVDEVGEIKVAPTRLASVFEINGRTHAFKVIHRVRDFGRFDDLVIAIVDRMGKVVAVVDPIKFTLTDEITGDVAATISGPDYDKLGTRAFIEACMDYAGTKGFRSTKLSGPVSVRGHLVAAWKLLWSKGPAS